MVLIQKEPKKIYCGIEILSDMQGPAPDGFHVPLNTERKAVGAIRVALGGGSSAGTNFGIALKLPFAGNRDLSSAGITSQGSGGYYWSSSRYDTSKAYYLSFYSTALYPQDSYYSAFGFSVRCFKDTPVIPTSSWTKLYGTSIEAGGIFWSSADGLISLSSNGTTWITIMDKNLGATTVWNSGNTLSEANCGKYYQRGNNYGFPFTGSVTTSSTRVDASTYGPGNYYSSSTFITRGGSPYSWDTTDNGNLRGGVSQGTSEKPREVKKVYIGSTQVRPKLRTFTITWEEKSNMSSGWTYSDDAAGLTAGSTAFDEFFGYSAVRLDTSGNVTAEVKQTTPGQLDFSQLGTLTSGDNVMIKFPVRGIKMTKSGSVVTLSITEELNKTGYQYYAHCTGTLSNPGTPKNAFYLGAYEGYSSSNVLKSRSGKGPTTSQMQATFCTFAKANGSGYNIIGYYQRQFVNALYMMKYGNPDCQTVVGRGFVDGNSASHVTGGLNSQLSATWGETAGKTQCKLFGLEDWWGNVSEWVGGVYTDSNNFLYTQLSGYSGTTSGGEYTGSTIQYTSGYNLSSIVGNNKVLFGPSATVSNSSYNTYYCDYVYVRASRLAEAGGGWNDGSVAGAFCLDVYFDASGSGTAVGSRLMFL